MRLERGGGGGGVVYLCAGLVDKRSDLPPERHERLHRVGGGEAPPLAALQQDVFIAAERDDNFNQNNKQTKQRRHAFSEEMQVEC